MSTAAVVYVFLPSGLTATESAPARFACWLHAAGGVECVFQMHPRSLVLPLAAPANSERAPL